MKSDSIRLIAERQVFLFATRYLSLKQAKPYKKRLYLLQLIIFKTDRDYLQIFFCLHLEFSLVQNINHEEFNNLQKG